jgi:hypothetical protein
MVLLLDAGALYAQADESSRGSIAIKQFRPALDGC